jgi:hypothetical protein
MKVEWCADLSRVDLLGAQSRRRATIYNECLAGHEAGAV